MESSSSVDEIVNLYKIRGIGYPNRQIQKCIEETAKTTNTEKLVVAKFIIQSLKVDISVACLSMNPRQLMNLSGPKVFAFYENVHGIKILLLGERHITIRRCGRKGYEISNWLYDIASVAPECLDIFVEDYYANQTIRDISKIPLNRQLCRTREIFREFNSH